MEYYTNLLSFDVNAHDVETFCNGRDSISFKYVGKDNDMVFCLDDCIRKLAVYKKSYATNLQFALDTNMHNTNNPVFWFHGHYWVTAKGVCDFCKALLKRRICSMEELKISTPTLCWLYEEYRFCTFNNVKEVLKKINFKLVCFKRPKKCSKVTKTCCRCFCCCR